MGVWLIHYKVGLNNVTSATQLSSMDFGISSATSTSAPDNDMSQCYLDNSFSKGLPVDSPCYTLGGSDVYRSDPLTFSQGVNKLFLNGRARHLNGSNVSTNTSYTFFKAIRIA